MCAELKSVCLCECEYYYICCFSLAFALPFACSHSAFEAAPQQRVPCTHVMKCNLACSVELVHWKNATWQPYVEVQPTSTYIQSVLLLLMIWRISTTYKLVFHRTPKAGKCYLHAHRSDSLYVPSDRDKNKQIVSQIYVSRQTSRIGIFDVNKTTYQIYFEQFVYFVYALRWAISWTEIPIRIHKYSIQGGDYKICSDLSFS